MSESLRLLIIKPSHYDDEGYVIQWWRNLIPTQTLAVLNGLLHDAAERQVLGPVAIEVRLIDESANVLGLQREVRWLQGARSSAVLLAGVQTNQYPRAVDLGRAFIAQGIAAIMGGFHVSGVLAMTPQWEAGLAEAREAGITLYAGEFEEGVDTLLEDIWNGTLPALYNLLDRLPDLEQAAPPRLDPDTLRHTLLRRAGIDLGRGCPYLCSFCTIINVQGRRPRQRTAEVAVDYVRQGARYGVRDFFISDDNFARNQNWEAILDALIQLREVEGLVFTLSIQVDLQATNIPYFVEKAVRAGCARVFLGIESLRDDNLLEMHKKQNRRFALRDVVVSWKRAGVLVHAFYIIGLPHDTPERLRDDVRELQERVPIDLINFFIYTPLPGSADHRRMLDAGVAMDADFNRYDAEHVVSDPACMSRSELQALYWELWGLYYTPEHILRLLKRALVHSLSSKQLMRGIQGSYAAVHIDHTHPLQSGLLRRKVRTSRRPGLPIVPLWRFVPARLWEVLGRQVATLRFVWRTQRLYRQALREVLGGGYHEGFLDEPVALGESAERKE